jgi:hypothetical protein
MTAETAVRIPRQHRAGRHVAVIVAAAALACSALPGTTAAAPPPRLSARSMPAHAGLHHREASPSLLAFTRRIAAVRRTGGSAHVRALPESGASLCVGNGAGCLRTIQAALDAAHDGDTIHVGPGTFAGGFTVAKSVRLVGSGARTTIIRGGGTVMTIGTFGATVEPTVLISGVTITGGISRSSPLSVAWTGEEGVIALGGGVEIPSNADFTGGATVTIADSVIRGNRVAPAKTVPSGGAACPDGPCPLALAAGGGIDSWGSLTLKNTTVADNKVGAASGLSALASDADAGGISSWQGSLTLDGSTVSGNQASATAPNGRFAEAGAIFALGGTLTITDSAVTDNHASLEAALPDSVDLAAIGGGMHIGGGVSTATIRRTTISGNALTMTNTVGYGNAFSGGIHSDIETELHGDLIADNHVISTSLAGPTSVAFGDSGAGELLSGTMTDTRFSGNSVTVRSSGVFAGAIAGAIVFRGGLQNVVITDNHVVVSAPNGGVFAAGGGLVEDWGGVSLTDSSVNRNSVEATGQAGSALGGGIFDAAIENGPPGGPLSLTGSRVERNAVSGGPGIDVQGGGIFTDNVVTLKDSVIAKNVPDQCVGC